MRLEVVYNSGQTYNETIRTGTAKIKQHSKRVTVWFKGTGPGKSEGTLALAKDDAERLARGILLACSAEDTLIQFPVGETLKQ